MHRPEDPGTRLSSASEEHMFSHVTVGTNDLERAAAFYDAVLKPLGLRQRVVAPDGGPPAACWLAPATSLPRFYVYSPFDGLPAGAGNGGMVAFLAPSPEAVDAAHAAGMSNGGADDGAPGPRPRYGLGYCGAYLRDPDGNKIHVVHRGDLQAGAPADNHPCEALLPTNLIHVLKPPSS